MKPLFFAAAAAIAFTGVPALAQSQQTDDSSVQVTPGKAQYYSKVRREATIEKIDAASRTVTLKMPDGELLDMTVDPSAKNLPKVKVGDKVVANYQEWFDITLLPAGSQAVGIREGSSSALAPEGQAPGASQTSQVTLTGNVVKVDQATGVVTVKGATESVDLTVSDPKQLALIKVGDQVQAVATQVLAVSLEPAS